MVLPAALDDTVTALETNITDLSTLQGQIDALPASPTTDQLVPIVQSLKDITDSLTSNLNTFVGVVKTIRLNQ
jgi:hypothetical protein